MIDILGLPGITPVDIRYQAKSIIISANAKDDVLPTCSECGKPMYRHGRRKGTFADTPIQMQPVRLEVIRTRYRCADCGKVLIPELPFLDESRRATKRLVNAIRERCLGSTFNSLAHQTGLAVNTVKNIAHDLINELERTVRYETPVMMGIDELHIAGDYRCIITNLATNNIFQMLERRTQAYLKPFFASLRNRDAVEWVCTDMWRPFKQSFGQYLPNARLVIDKFHVLKMASEALDLERKNHQENLSRNERIHVKKSIRWITLKRPNVLTAMEKSALAELRNSIPILADAYDLKEAFYRIYDEQDKESAMNAFLFWKSVLPKKDFNGFSKLAKTVDNHLEYIFAYWDSPHRITNAYTECLNGLVKIANRMGRGYSYEIIRAKTLYEKQARKVGSGIRSVIDAQTPIPTSGTPQSVEYGPHIPTLIDMVESGRIT